MSTISPEFAANEAASRSERQVVAFHLGEEVYGIDIAIIHTVITPQDITDVPKTPKYVRGIINLRGRILPVIDMRTRFDLPALSEEKQKNVRVVIVDTEGLTVGLIVDAVSEVLTLPENAIEPPSSIVTSRESEFVTGIGRISNHGADEDKPERLILLLDVVKAATAGDRDVSKLKKLQKAA